MTTPRRRGALALGLLLPGLLLAGCGGSEEEPTSYVVTDLGGETAAPGGVEIPDTTPSSSPDPASEPTQEPTRKPTGKPSGEPTRTPPSTPGVTGADLVRVIAAAAGRLDTVQITIGDQGATPDLRAGVVYGDTDAFDATLDSTSGQPEAVFRRIGGTLYAGTSAGLEAVDPQDDRLVGDPDGIVAAFLAWSPLADLRAVLESAQGVLPGAETEADGVAVTSFSFTADLASLPRPSLVAPDDTTGEVEATLLVGDDSLPRRLELALDSGTVVVGYSAWGGRVQILAPQPSPGG